MNALLALTLLAAPAHPDTLQFRKGLYIGFTVGPALVGTAGQGSAMAPHVGAGIGLAIAPHFTAGLHHDLWGSGQQHQGFATTALAVSWYPVANGGAFIRPSAGIATYDADPYYENPSESGDGFAFGVTLGHDLRFDRRLSLTPTFTIQYTEIGNGSITGFPEGKDIKSWMVGIGVGLTWH